MAEQPVRPEPTTGTPPQQDGVVDAGLPASRNAGVADSLAIIASKIEPPNLGNSVLTRPRLVGWLDQQKRARVLLVAAEAGYGKSTLLGDFSTRTDATCVWYRLETSDGDWITFVSHLVAAVRRAYPGFGQPTEALLRHMAAMGPSREVVVATFLSDLGTLGSASVILILDDYHHVDGSEDVRMIMARLLERAPAAMRFVVAGRGRPDLSLGRLTAQGRTAELTTNDLRFTRAEIEELFDAKYGQPLARETCDVVEGRTEGWAASLQLVSASIAASRPSEVDQFIEALSGANGPIYDFLAEEVLSRLAPQTQRVLVHASLLDRVTPDLVAAALSVGIDPVSASESDACLREVEVLGLIGQRADAGSGVRIHPLLREFLEHHLALQRTHAEIKAMHLAIATSAEGSDWLVSGKHYARAGEPDEAMRVLGAAASKALGTGAWGAAAEVVASMPDTPPPPAVQVIKARALIDSGSPGSALRLLESIDEDLLDGSARALLRLTRATALHTEGGSEPLGASVAALASSASAPFPFREVATAWQQMLVANEGGSIADASEALAVLHGVLENAGLHYFAGITSHNFAHTEVARGRYGNAIRLARNAITQLARTSEGGAILASTRLISATALAETGRTDDAVEMAIDVATGRSATADSIVEAAYICAVVGRPAKARSLLARFDRGDARGYRELSSRAQACYARIACCVVSSNLAAAQTPLRELAALRAPEIDAKSRLAVVRAMLAVLARHRDAAPLSANALRSCESQGAYRWMARARILDSVARRDGEGLALWIEETLTDSTLALFEMAEVVSSAVDLLSGAPELLDQAILRSPGRWIPALAHQVATGEPKASAAAAALVSRFGTIEDASVLRDYDRTSGRRSKRAGYVTKLVRRVSPTVRLHDLGPTSYEIGNRRVSLSETRRKSASLSLFLVTRSGLAATREQVMEGLWPDLPPKSGLNSLHQTLFFLRRDIEPWYEEGATADYVRVESDLVFLDPELFQVDSVAFARQSANILATRSASSRGPELLRLYQGRFAPEFEYEEWAQEWRDQLHGAFLHLAHATAQALMRERRHEDAVEVLTKAASIDMLAYDLRAMLVESLAAVGSVDAARAHYKSMAALHLQDLGMPARPYEEVISGTDSVP